MTLITDTGSLAAFCDSLRGTEYIAVDTEFMRETTYWPKLCLVQLAGPEAAVAVDPLAPGLDLAPVLALMADPSILKVFHAGRQDVEIVLNLSGQVPAPLFDTQIAAMVCGFGDQVGYEQMIARLTGARIDKSSRFTDWSHRPLTERQIRYALDDVIHLRPAFEKLRDQLARTGRESWVAEEMASLADPAAYQTRPEDAWLRLKTRSTDGRFLVVLRELAAWREAEAQRRDLPRGRVLRDEALLEIAAHRPADVAELGRTRGLGRGLVEGAQGAAILAAVARALALPADQRPRVEDRPMLPSTIGPTVELLRVLLKLNADAAGVAQRLVASASELEHIAADDGAPVPSMTGWRRTIFGEDALALKHGRIALALRANEVVKVPLAETAPI